MAFSSSWGSWTRISPALSAWRASESQSRSRSHPGWSSSARARAFGLCARRGPVCRRAACWCPGSAGASPRTTSACPSQWTRPRKHLRRKSGRKVDMEGRFQTKKINPAQHMSLIHTHVILCFQRGGGDERSWPRLRRQRWAAIFNSFFLTVIDKCSD